MKLPTGEIDPCEIKTDTDDKYEVVERVFVGLYELLLDSA